MLLTLGVGVALIVGTAEDRGDYSLWLSITIAAAVLAAVYVAQKPQPKE